jgi:hypothetical protein
VIRAGFDQLERTRPLPSHVRKACRRIIKCKTSALGHHVIICDNGHEHIRWDSCRQRACPECSWPARKRWLLKTRRRLLDCPHHHAIFTIAHELNGLWLANVPEMRHLLFAAVRDTLVELFASHHRGAVPGIIAVLHTWSRDLFLHAHLHLIVTHGGVDPQGRWRTIRGKTLLPASVVSELFRGKFLDAVKRGLAAGRLAPPRDSDLAAERRNIDAAYGKKWNVFIDFAGSRLDTVVGYLGRYVLGGPIGNNRILALDEAEVTFLYRDYRTAAPGVRPAEYPKTLLLDEFLQRWCLHIPMPYTKTVRGYGLYAPGRRGARPRPPRRRGVAEPKTETLPSALDVPRCPECGAPLRMPRAAPQPSTRPRDPPIERLDRRSAMP